MIHLQSNRTTGSYLFWVVYNFNWFDLTIESINYFFSAIWFWHSSLFAAWCKAVMAVVTFSACTAWLPHSLLLFWVCSLPPLTVKCFLPWNSETVISFITDCSIIAGVILCDVDLKSFDNKHTQMVLGFCKPFEGNLWNNIPCHIWKWYICYQIHDGIQTCIALPLLLVNLLLYLDPFSDWCYFLFFAVVSLFGLHSDHFAQSPALHRRCDASMRSSLIIEIGKITVHILRPVLTTVLTIFRWSWQFSDAVVARVISIWCCSMVSNNFDGFCNLCQWYNFSSYYCDQINALFGKSSKSALHNLTNIKVILSAQILAWEKSLFACSLYCSPPHSQLL